MQVTPRGFLAFIHSNEQLNDLSDTILDRAQLPDLQQNMYHGSAATGGSGVTSSVTTHEDPDGTDPNVYGVSDIMVTVTVDADDPTRDDDTPQDCRRRHRCQRHAGGTCLHVRRSGAQEWLHRLGRRHQRNGDLAWPTRRRMGGRGPRSRARRQHRRGGRHLDRLLPA